MRLTGDPDCPAYPENRAAGFRRTAIGAKEGRGRAALTVCGDEMIGRFKVLSALARGKLLQAGRRGIVMPRGTAAPAGQAIVTMGGRISAGENCALATRAILHAEVGTITLGRNVFVGVGAMVTARQLVEIGDDVLIAEYVTIRD